MESGGLENEARVLAERVEANLRPVFLRGGELRRVAREKRGRIHHVVRDPVGVTFDEALHLAYVIARDPPRELVACRREACLDAILVLEPVRNDFELKLTDRAEQHGSA